MADSKITALTAISTVDPTADPLVIVDVSDTSMAASGTTKKSTINQLLGAGGTATLASATITGDLTVDTSTLKVDSTNNVVGITNASPLTGTDGGLTLGVIGSSKAMAISMFNCFARLRERDAVNNFAITTNIDTTNAVLDDNTRTSWKVRFGSGNDNFLIQRAAIGSTTFQDLYSVSTTSAVWSDGAGGTRMTLNATGLGVGGSASARIHAIDSGGGCALFTRAAAPAAALSAIYIQAPVSSGFTSSPVMNFWYQNTGISNPANECFAIRTSSTDRLYIDSAGNCGIGVTPSASWVTYKALEFDTGIVSGSSSMALNRNCYFDGVNWRYKVTTSFGIAQYQLSGNGNHIWNIASSGNAGAAINGGTGAWTEAMKLDTSGNLILSPSNTPATLTTNGQLTVNATSNTNLRFSYRGSDGTTRVANITLA